MGKKSPTEVYLVIRERFSGSALPSNRALGGGSYTSRQPVAAFTSREEARRYLSAVEEVQVDDRSSYEIDRLDLLTHAPPHRDVYVVSHRWENRSLAAMTPPTGRYERVFAQGEILNAVPWAARPQGHAPMVSIRDERIFVWGLDEERCWDRFYEEAERHDIPYFGEQGAVNAPPGVGDSK